MSAPVQVREPAEARTLERARRALAIVAQIAHPDRLLVREVTWLAREINEQLAGLTGAARSSVWLRREDRPELSCLDCYEAGSALHSTGAVRLQADFADQAGALKSAGFMVSTSPSPGQPPAMGAATILDVEISAAGRMLGLLRVEHVAQPQPWAPDEIGLARQLAGLLAVALVFAERERLRRALQALAACNGLLARRAQAKDLLDELCRAITGAGGYRLAWIGVAEQDAARSVRPVASSGDSGGYLDGLRISWADVEQGRGPTGTAIRTGKPQVNRGTQDNPGMHPWQARAARHGFGSSISLPLLDARGVFGALSIYASEAYAFGPEEAGVLAELAKNVSHALRAAAAPDAGHATA